MGLWATTNSKRPPAPEPCTPQSVLSATIPARGAVQTLRVADTLGKTRRRSGKGHSSPTRKLRPPGALSRRASTSQEARAHPPLLRRDPAQPPSRSHLGRVQMTRPISRGSPRVALQSQQPALPGGEKPPVLPQVWQPRSAPAMPSQGLEEPSGWQPSKRLRSLPSTRGHAVCT